MQTVLAVGSTGNIGVSAVIGALRSKYNVLAVVRNQASADKLFQHVGTRDGITTVEADITSDKGIQSVVDKVKAGQLPAFQHVYSSAGMWQGKSLQELDTATFRETMNLGMETNYFAYRATIPYLLEQNDPASTWTLVTGGAGELGVGGATAMGQGALFAMATVASRDHVKTSIRFNELYLNMRVDYDSVAAEKGSIKASEFGRVYEGILADSNIKGSRVSVTSKKDMETLSYKKKLP